MAEQQRHTTAGVFLLASPFATCTEPTCTEPTPKCKSKNWNTKTRLQDGAPAVAGQFYRARRFPFQLFWGILHCNLRTWQFTWTTLNAATSGIFMKLKSLHINIYWSSPLMVYSMRFSLLLFWNADEWVVLLTAGRLANEANKAQHFLQRTPSVFACCLANISTSLWSCSKAGLQIKWFISGDSRSRGSHLHMWAGC